MTKLCNEFSIVQYKSFSFVFLLQDTRTLFTHFKLKVPLRKNISLTGRFPRVNPNIIIVLYNINIFPFLGPQYISLFNLCCCLAQYKDFCFSQINNIAFLLLIISFTKDGGALCAFVIIQWGHHSMGSCSFSLQHFLQQEWGLDYECNGILPNSLSRPTLLCTTIIRPIWHQNPF